MTDKKTASNDRETFLQALARALWDIHQANHVRRSVGDQLANFGITCPDTDGKTAPEAFDINSPEDTYIGSGVYVSDLSPEKQAAHRAKELLNLRRSAYTWLRDQVEDYGRYNAGEVVRHFGKLEFPMPKQVSTVSAEVRQGDTAEYVCATVDGEMTREQVIEKLTPFASNSPAHLLTVAAFGDGSHSEDLVQHISIRTRTEWPSTDEIK